MLVPEKYRIKTGELSSDETYGCNGAFYIPLTDKTSKKIIYVTVFCSNGYGWEHVSVSLMKKTPSWEQMCKIKNLFWDEEDTVIQYHPAESDYVNYHPRCLHLWRPINAEIPKPPTYMIGPKNLAE